MVRLFDSYVFVDWSASSTPSPLIPSPDAVWIGTSDHCGAQRERYCRTREEAVGEVRRLLLEEVGAAHRVLCGFDFPYGYPKGLARVLGLGSAPGGWRRVWDELAWRIVDTPANISNRFAVASALNGRIGGTEPGPFWGCSQKAATATLSPYKPRFPYAAGNGVLLSWLRLVETRLRGAQETWKLLGVGSVGSQALLGIPRVWALRLDPALRRRSLVWPFETGFTASPVPEPGPFLVHAEIWPGVLNRWINPWLQRHPDVVKDRGQVRALCWWAATLDARGQLACLFDRPEGVAPAEVEQCEDEEGWVLGVGATEQAPDDLLTELAAPEADPDPYAVTVGRAIGVSGTRRSIDGQ